MIKIIFLNLILSIQTLFNFSNISFEKVEGIFITDIDVDNKQFLTSKSFKSKYLNYTFKYLKLDKNKILQCKPYDFFQCKILSIHNGNIIKTSFNIINDFSKNKFYQLLELLLLDTHNEFIASYYSKFFIHFEFFNLNGIRLSKNLKIPIKNIDENRIFIHFDYNNYNNNEILLSYHKDYLNYLSIFDLNKNKIIISKFNIFHNYNSLNSIFLNNDEILVCTKDNLKINFCIIFFIDRINKKLFQLQNFQISLLINKIISFNNNNFIFWASDNKNKNASSILIYKKDKYIYKKIKDEKIAMKKKIFNIKFSIIYKFPNIIIGYSLIENNNESFYYINLKLNLTCSDYIISLNQIQLNFKLNFIYYSNLNKKNALILFMSNSHYLYTIEKSKKIYLNLNNEYNINNIFIDLNNIKNEMLIPFHIKIDNIISEICYIRFNQSIKFNESNYENNDKDLNQSDIRFQIIFIFLFILLIIIIHGKTFIKKQIKNIKLSSLYNKEYYYTKKYFFIFQKNNLTINSSIFSKLLFIFKINQINYILILSLIISISSIKNGIILFIIFNLLLNKINVSEKNNILFEHYNFLFIYDYFHSNKNKNNIQFNSKKVKGENKYLNDNNILKNKLNKSISDLFIYTLYIYLLYKINQSLFNITINKVSFWNIIYKLFIKFIIFYIISIIFLFIQIFFIDLFLYKVHFSDSKIENLNFKIISILYSYLIPNEIDEIFIALYQYTNYCSLILNS